MNPVLHINHDQLAREIVRAIRGEATQRDLSRKLGYTFNQVGKWESGSTHISWDDFVQLATSEGHDIEKHFRRIFWSFVGDSDGAFNSKSVINYFLTDHRFIQRALASSTRTIRRLKAGESHVMLADVHRLIALQPSLLMGWLEGFTDPSQIPEVQAFYAWHLKCLELVAGNPLAVFVKASVELDAYKNLERHSDEFVARHATCSTEEAHATLKQLLDLGCVEFDGTRYTAEGDCFSFGSLANTRLKSLTKFSTSLTAQRYLTVPSGAPAQDWINPSVSSVRVRPMSKEASNKVLALVEKFHRDVADIVAKDEGEKTNVQILLMHFYASVANAPAKPGAPDSPAN